MRLPFLDRYVIRELIPPFIMALALFLLYILVAALLGVSMSFRDFDLALEDTLRMMMYKLPEMLVLALPFAVLFAVLLACGRLSHDREIIALQNSGVSLRRITLTFLGFGAFIGLLTFAIQDVIVPWTATQSQHQMSQLLGEGPITKIQQNTVFKDRYGRLIYIERYDPESGQLKNIHIIDPNGSIGSLTGEPRQNQLVTASSGEWRENAWVLNDGVVHVLNPDGSLIYQAVFKSQTILVDQAFGQLLFARQPEQMNYSELSQYIKTLQVTGRSVTHLIVELQTKLIFPFSALVYALIAAPLPRPPHPTSAIWIVSSFSWPTRQCLPQTVAISSRPPAQRPRWAP